MFSLKTYNSGAYLLSLSGYGNVNVLTLHICWMFRNYRIPDHHNIQKTNSQTWTKYTTNHPPQPFSTPDSGGMLCDINVFYTPLEYKVRLMRYNSVAVREYLHSFSCCWLSNLRNLANSERIRAYSSSKSSKVIDLVVNRYAYYATSY